VLESPRFTEGDPSMNMKKMSLVCVLLGAVVLAFGIVQCGGDTSTSNGPLNSTTGDGGTAGAGGTTGVPQGW
jgi:hypothetical protein